MALSEDLLTLAQAWQDGRLQTLHLERRRKGTHIRGMMPKRTGDERQPEFALTCAPEVEALRVAAMTTRVMIEEEIPDGDRSDR